jgi:hypothetical protein
MRTLIGATASGKRPLTNAASPNAAVISAQSALERNLRAYSLAISCF